MQKYDLRSVAFPTLSEAEMASLDSCPLTVLNNYKTGEKLFRAGDCDSNFFVVKSGEIEIVDESGDTSHVIAVLQPGLGRALVRDGREGMRPQVRRGDDGARRR